MDLNASVSVRVLRTLISAAVAVGVDRDVLLESIGLERKDLEDLDARLPLESVVSFWREAPQLSGDSNFGLRASQQVDHRSLGVFDFTISRSLTLGDAYERLCRFVRVLLDGPRFRFRTLDGDRIAIGGDTFGAEPSRHREEFIVGWLYRLGRHASGIEWRPLEVRFPHLRPNDTSAHDEVFGAPCSFDCDASELVLETELLDTPLRSADPVVLRILDRRLEALLESLPKKALGNVVRWTISRELIEGNSPSLERTARAMGTSTRTLQRQLQSEGLTYNDVLDDVRRDLATRYLDADDIGIGEVAFLLGFSEPSAFYRAFKRWTGLTPADYRHRRG